MAKKFEFGNEDPKSASGNEISIANSYSISVKEKYGMIYPENRVANMYRTLFRSVAIFLKHSEAKSTPRIGFSLLNDRGDFSFGAMVVYHEPEDGEETDKGNWTLSFTFNQDDIKECDKMIDNHSDTFVAISEGEVYNVMFGNFSDPVSMNQMYNECIEILKNFLDNNSNDGEEVELTLPGVFTAMCGFEDGIKVFSITPGATVKQLVKDDMAVATGK